MEILDLYLKEVRRHLPRVLRDDVIRELSENLRSQLADRAEELGRPLSEAEQEELLAQHGHPIVVASTYRQDKRRVVLGWHLIGPALFPLYLKILGINLGLTTVVFVVVAYFLRTPPRDAAQSYLFIALLQAVIVTLIFTLVERSLTPVSAQQSKLLDRYLKAVRIWLPRAQRQDILDELAANIHSKMEDKAAELGRPLSEADLEAILRAHGHPMQVAARYAPGKYSLALGWELIGPQLFPFYILLLSFNVALTLALPAGILYALGREIHLQMFILPVSIQVGTVTFLFVLLQFILSRWPNALYQWNPKPKLPILRKSWIL